MPAPTRRNLTYRARSLRVPHSDVEHLSDEKFGEVVAYRADLQAAKAAKELLKLIEMGEDFGCLADVDALARDDSGLRAAVDKLVEKFEELGLVPETAR